MPRSPATPEPAGDPLAQTRRFMPWLVAMALFMENLDATIVNTAVPTMAASLGVEPLSLKGVLTSYTLSLAVFIPVSGWIADRFGTRRVFHLAIWIVLLGSLVAAWFLGAVDRTSAAQVIPALHHAFFTLGLITIVSSATFLGLHPHDGNNVSNRSPLPPRRVESRAVLGVPERGPIGTPGNG